MDFLEYQHWCVKNATTPHPEFCAALGIAGEAGEVADLIKKERCHGAPRDSQKMLKELGDVLWYLSVVAAQYGFTLEQVKDANIAKLRARYTDDGKFNTAESLARKDLGPPDEMPVRVYSCKYGHTGMGCHEVLCRC